VTQAALIRAARGALLLYLLAFLLLAAAGAQRNDMLVSAAAVCLFGAATFVQVTLGRARQEGLLRRLRRWLPVCVVVAGGLLIAYWARDVKVGSPTGGWGLSGMCACYLGIGLGLAEIRFRHPAAGWSIGLLALCAVGFAAGLELALHASVGWGIAAVASLLAAPAGLTLLSERVLRQQPPRLRFGWVLGPILIAAGVLLLILAVGFEPAFAWATAFALVVLVAAIASDSQVDILVLVTAAVLVWATAPHGVKEDKGLAPSKGEPALVSLGDSYMSGEGAQRFFEDTNRAERNECRRSPSAYAPRVVKSKASPLHRLAFFACSGALAEHISGRAQYPGEPVDSTPDEGADQLTQLKGKIRDGVDVRLIIVSIGGNDADFSTIGSSCLAPGSCVERGQHWLDQLKTVSDRVDAAYKDLRDAAPGVPVLAVPYPQPLRDAPCRYSQLGQDEDTFVNGFVDELDGVIERSARRAGFHYLGGMVDALRNERLRICDGPQKEMGVNFIALKSIDGVVDQRLFPSKWIHNSLHPNATGHGAMARVLEKWMADHPDPRPKEPEAVAPYVPPSLDDLMGSPVSHCGEAGREPDYCDRDDTEWAITQVVLWVQAAAIPILLIVIGAWLLALPLLVRTGPWFAKLGAWLERQLLGWPGVRPRREDDG
jgi:hypothetical protein